MKVKMFLLGMAFAVVLFVPAVSAQVIPESSLSSSTFGIFGDDIDSYLDPNDYQDVEFEKGFGFIQAPGILAAGYSTRLKDSTYLGFYLGGPLWDGTSEASYNNGNREDGTESGVGFTGDIGFLLGMEKIGGIKATFQFEDVKLAYDKKGGDETINSDGYFTIGVGWGKNFDLKGGVLSPELALRYKINTFKEQTKSDQYTYLKQSGNPATPDQKKVFDSLSHLILDAQTYYYFSSGTSWLNGEYVLDIGTWPTPIAKSGGAETTFEGWDIAHTLIFEYGRQFDITSQLAFGIKAGADLGYESQRSRWNGIAGKEVIRFGIAPHAEVAAKYAFAAKPISLYTGFQFAPYERTPTPRTGGAYDKSIRVGDRAYAFQVETTYPDYNKLDTRSEVGVFNPWGVNAGLGLGFNPLKNFFLDLNLSSNLAYLLYRDDTGKTVFAIGDWQSSPITFSIQGTIKL
ncbi:hypothetical protein AGMMS50268_32930 [Spirochaetia bacterium]|nr:hypothetical protein AGMMS50268_32930 [Spirochaetia bacterium]